MSDPFGKPISLVLSGGGIRAMVFHMGVLKYLAEQDALESVEHISTVSGGSLITGLILQSAGLQWPSSGEYLQQVYPALRTQLCNRSPQWGAVRQLLRPRNWQYLLSRANALAAALRHEWKIQARLNDLPASPAWSINGTNAENGARFRFKRDSLGDYKSGYASADDFTLADAMAVSAAFPGGFGPLRLSTHRYSWRKRQWDAPESSATVATPAHRFLHLYDGGVYDNLGLEPYFDAGRGEPKHAGQFILVSDAGAPLAPGFAHGPFSPFRLKRVADIMSDQSRALRVRTFVHYLLQGAGRGALVLLASPAIGTDQERAFVSAFPTTLTKLSLATFDLLADRGYAVAKGLLAEQLVPAVSATEHA